MPYKQDVAGSSPSLPIGFRIQALKNSQKMSKTGKQPNTVQAMPMIASKISS
jgi:hypothetical protein